MSNNIEHRAFWPSDKSVFEADIKVPYSTEQCLQKIRSLAKSAISADFWHTQDVRRHVVDYYNEILAAYAKRWPTSLKPIASQSTPPIQGDGV